jgi:hypothetical protein
MATRPGKRVRTNNAAGAAGNNNNNNNKNLNLTQITEATLPWGDRRLDMLRPYVQSAFQARIDLAQQMGLPVPRYPKMSDVYLALAISTGTTFSTVGRGNALESAPFVPGVAAIPAIPRGLWSTTSAVLPQSEIMRIMPSDNWGLKGPPASISNRPSTGGAPMPSNSQDNQEGGISSFYHPAFMQICIGQGEWLVNGFKVNKAAIESKAATLSLSVTSISNPTGKGFKQSESDILKVTIYPYREGAVLKFGIKFTVGEAKSGLGEASGKKGAEVAQLRYTLMALYIMWREIHTAPAYHPWKNIEKITFEGCFIGAGAQSIYDIIITEQQKNSVIAVTGVATTPVDIRRVNLPRFCAIFRLDRFRFALARTGIVDVFKNKILTLYSLSKNNAVNAVGRVDRNVTETTQIPLKSTLQGYSLSTNGRFSAARNKFKMAVLSTPRNRSTLNENLYNVGFIRNAANNFTSHLAPGETLSAGDKLYISKIRKAYTAFWSNIIRKSGGVNVPNLAGRTRNSYFSSLPSNGSENANMGTGNNTNNARSNVSGRLGPSDVAARLTVGRTGTVNQPLSTPLKTTIKEIRTGTTIASRGGNIGTWVSKFASKYKPDPGVLRAMATQNERNAAIRNAKKKAFINISGALAQNIRVGQINSANIRTLISRVITPPSQTGRPAQPGRRRALAPS